jgi:hypothetical protein
MEHQFEIVKQRHGTEPVITVTTKTIEISSNIRISMSIIINNNKTSIWVEVVQDLWVEVVTKYGNQIILITSMKKLQVQQLQIAITERNILTLQSTMVVT